MSRKNLRLIAPFAAAVAVMLSVPAYATDIQFASYNAPSPLAVKATNSAGVATLSETGAVNFTFLSTNLASAVNGAPATVVFTATAPNSDFSTNSPHTYQEDLSGSFVFTSTNAITVGSTTYAAGSNLLTVTFTGAELDVKYHSSTGSLSDDSYYGTVTYSSAFLTFPNTVSSDFGVQLSGVNPVFASPLTKLPAFTASPSGIFSNDPGPISNADVPEPATWGMMLVGLGAIGLSLRGKTRRGQQAV